MKREAMEVRDASVTYAPILDVPVVPSGYKQTEVGVIPEDWEAVPARELGVFKGGSGFPLQAQGGTSGDYPFFKVSDMNNEGNDTFMSSANNYISAATRKRLGANLFPAGSIVFAKVGAAIFLERKKVLRQASCIDNNMAAFVLERDRSEVRYIHSLLLSRNLGAFVSTTALPALNGKQLGDMHFPVPPIAEQRAIATALSDVDALLAVLDRLIAKKRDIKQATMQQLLTGQARLPGFNGEWEDKPLGKLGNFLKGSGIKREEARSGSLPCVRYGEIYTLHDDIVREFYSWISKAVAQTAVRVQKGDVLFAGSGETKEEIGKCAAITNDVEAYAGGDIVILRTRVADPKFLGYALNQPSINLQKSRFGQGDAVVHISASSLSQVIIGLPPLAEQEAISSILIDMDTEIEALEQRHTKATALKQAMMQGLLTGRTRLVNPGHHKSRGDKLYSNKSKANVHFMRSVFAAEIVDQLHQEPTFGHVKFEKVLFLAEHLCDVDTGSTYHRKAAGPYDNRALRSIDSQIRKQQWFEARKEKGRYRYIPLDQRGAHKKYFDRYFFHVNDAFRKVVENFRTLDTERCEIVATLFSAWDDLLHKQATVSDEMIVHDVLNNWHDSKQRIAEGRWFKALEWMREKGLVPKAVSSPGSDSRVAE